MTEKPTLLGAQASVGGFYLGPLYFYGIAGLYALFGPIPQMLSLGFAVLNVIAGWLGYRFLAAKVNRLSGFLFLFLFSTQPLLIEASRSATHAPMLPFLTILSIVLFFKAKDGQQVRDFVFAGIAFGLFLHVHFSAFLLFPGAFLLLTFITKGNWKARLQMMLGFGLGMLLMITPLLFFDGRHGFLLSKAFLVYIRETIQGGTIRDSFPHWSISQKASNLASYLGPTWRIHVAALGLSLWGLFRVIRERKLSKNSIVFMITGWCLLMIVLLFLYSGYLFSYYLIVPGMVVILTISILLSKLPHALIAILFILLIAVLNLKGIGPIYKPHFRTLSNLSRITQSIQSHLQSQGTPPFTVFKDSSDQLTGLGYEYRFLLETQGNRPTSEYTYDAAKILYLIREEGTNDPLTLGGHEMGQFGAKRVELVESLQFHDRTVDIFALYTE